MGDITGNYNIYLPSNLRISAQNDDYFSFFNYIDNLISLIHFFIKKL